jgi:hypothetical protein
MSPFHSRSGGTTGIANKLPFAPASPTRRHSFYLQPPDPFLLHPGKPPVMQ